MHRTIDVTPISAALRTCPDRDGRELAVAVHYLRTKHAERSGAVVWTASDEGERRALAVERA